jgi:small-conductance mechanosensitive channel
MTELLSRTFLGNPIQAWLIALVASALAYFGLKAVRRLVTLKLSAIAKRTDTPIDDFAAELVSRTRPFFLAAVAVYVALTYLVLSPGVAANLRRLLLLALLLQIGFWANVAVKLWVERYLARREALADRAGVATIQALGVGALALVWIMLFLTALGTYGVNVTALVTGLGIGGIAIALAVQSLLGDLLAAIAIVFDKPFDVGDAIFVDGQVGIVEHIGIKTTRLRALSGEQVIITNSDLIKVRIRNFKRMYQRRVNFSVDVTYDTPPEVMERIPPMVREIVEAQPLGKFDRCHFAAFAESSLRIETIYFVLDPDFTKYMDTHQAINLEILRRFNAQGIKFAFPSRTVYVEQELVGEARGTRHEAREA